MWCFIHFSFYMNTQLLCRCIIQTHQHDKYSHRIKCTAPVWISYHMRRLFIFSVEEQYPKIKVSSYQPNPDGYISYICWCGARDLCDEGQGVWSSLWDLCTFAVSGGNISETTTAIKANLWKTQGDGPRWREKLHRKINICIPPWVALNGSAGVK